MDIVEDLRTTVRSSNPDFFQKAADEIERLTDENERLREVLNAVLFAFDNDTATAAQLRKVYATEIAKAQALLTPNALAQADAACGVSPGAMGSASLVEQGEKQ